MCKNYFRAHADFMRRVAVWVGLLAVGCGSPEDAFVGRYFGPFDCIGEWDDGSPYVEASDQTMGIERATDGSLYHAADCTLPLVVIGPTRAEYVRTMCNVVLETGDPATLTYESGVMDLREPFLDVESNIRLQFNGGVYFTAHCSFDGERVE
jgi:hypothetical protein